MARDGKSLFHFIFTMIFSHHGGQFLVMMMEEWIYTSIPIILSAF